VTDEEVLAGGSVNHVVRVGDTVRRPTGPWTPAVHSFLRHLELVGYPYAPRVLGVDEQDREVLTFIPGQALRRPWPTALQADEVLDQIGRALGLLAQASAGFVPPVEAVWQAPDARRAGPVRHGDVGPWNAIFRDGELVGFIDWDFAGPAPALWDLAQAAWYYVPLRPPDRGWRGCGFPAEPDLRARLGRLCSAYGTEVSGVVDELVQLQHDELATVQTLGGQGRAPWAQFLQRGDVETISREIRWLRERRRDVEPAA